MKHFLKFNKALIETRTHFAVAGRTIELSEFPNVLFTKVLVLNSHTPFHCNVWQLPFPEGSPGQAAQLSPSKSSRVGWGMEA